MSQALYRKYRPHAWDEVVGQEHVTQTLRNAVAGERVAHAYLLAGPRGTGKTTTARLLAKAVNCLADDLSERPCDHCPNCVSVNENRFMDLIEIDAASNTSVEDVRDLRDKINFSPSQGRLKVYIIDEVHMLSTAAFNALLKTLEEPPPHAMFILATTEVHKIPATVLSRCQRHEFRRVPVKEISDLLAKMAADEGIKIDEEALTVIARQATGSVRDGISLLDQLASVGKDIDLEMALTVLGTATSQVVVKLISAVLEQQPAEGLSEINRALDAGTDPRQFARQVVDYLRNLLLFRMDNASQVETTQEMRAQMMEHSQAFSLPGLLATLRAFNAAATDQRTSWQPGLSLELAFAEAVEIVSSPAQAAPAAAQTAPVAWNEPAARAEPSARQQPRSEPRSEPRPARTAPPPRAAEPAAAPAASLPESGSTAAEPTAAASEAPRSEPAPWAATAGAAAAAGTGSVNMQALTQAWPKVRALLRTRKKQQTEALLNSCKPMGIRDGVLILGFASEVIKSKMEMGENVQVTREAIQQVLGVDLVLSCAINNGKGSKLPPGVDVDNDGMVGTALRDLGGEVVDVK